LISQRREAEVVAEERREKLVVWVVAAVEEGRAPKMLAEREELREEVAEAVGRDLMAEKTEERVEAEVVVRREMMRRLLEGLVAAVLVGLKVQNFWALEEVEERVRTVAEEAVRLELETVY
jgi:hypothetical protein